MEANKILNEKEENMGKTKQEGTLVENLERTLSKHRELLTVNSKLATLKDPNNTTRDKKSKVEKLETAARETMGKLKKAQESARKAIENRGKSKTWTAYDILEEVLDDTAEPTPEDIAGMLKAVLERTRPKETVQELSDDEMMINDVSFKGRDTIWQIASIRRGDKFQSKTHPVWQQENIAHKW